MRFLIGLNLTRRLLLPKSLRLSLARRRLNLRRLQRRTFPSLLLEPLKKDRPFGDLAPEVEAVAPPIEEPPPLRNIEVQAPLPLSLPNIPVGGRLAHFAQNWAEISDDKWVLSVVRKGYRIPFLKHPILSPDPVFFQQPLSQQLEEEIASLLSKGAVEEIIQECPGYYSRIFPLSQEERETQADNRPLCAQPFCLHRDIQNGDTEKSERRHSVKRLGIFIGSDGRLFACPDTSSVSQIPQIHAERSSVPVQGTPIRPLDKSFRVYTPYEGHCDIPKEKGDNSTYHILLAILPAITKNLYM